MSFNRSILVSLETKNKFLLVLGQRVDLIGPELHGGSAEERSSGVRWDLASTYVLRPLKTAVSQFQRGRGSARVKVRIRAQGGTEE